GMMHVLAGYLSLIYMALFLYRHQLIVPIGSCFKFSKASKISFFAILTIPFGSIGFSYYSININIYTISNSSAHLNVNNF
ncbi:hypothetical protein PMAYCL1PPCAC_09220, partial [Pristionchus mayeri]